MKWYENVYRRLLVDMHINDTDPLYLSSFDPEQYFHCLELAHIQSPMIYLQSHTGLCYFPTKVAGSHQAMEGENNKIKQLVRLCQDRGLKAVGYYSLIFNNVAVEKHPEWEMKYSDGSTWREHGQRYGLCCPNNPEYRQFLEENIREMADYFSPIDAVFYDMPYWEVTCHCPSCQNRYRKETGKKLPEVEDWNDPNWLLYVKKRQDWMAEFAQFAKNVHTRYFPKSTFELNYAAVIGCDWLGGSTEAINEVSEFTGGDLYGNLYAHSFTAKYYYGISKNQPFEYMTCRCNHTLREHTITKPQAMLDREVMLTAAHHGANLFIDAINPDGTLDERVYQKIGKALEKEIPYEPFLKEGKLYGDVAIYFDSKTMFKEPNSHLDNKDCAIRAHQTLVERHIPVRIIANHNLENLSAYPMILAPCLQDFDNDEPLKFIDYVRNGGVLYLSGKSDKRLMEAFFHASFSHYTYGDSPYAHVDKGYPEVQAYIAPDQGYESLGNEFNEKYPLPITYKLPVYENMEGRYMAHLVLPYTDPDNRNEFASIHSNPPGKASDIPLLVEVNYGKGRVIWSSAEIEADERVNFKDILINVIHRYITPKYQVEAPEYVESLFFEKGNELYLSLADLNAYYESRVQEVTITLPYSAKKVEQPVTGEILPASNTFKVRFQEFTLLKINKD